jgi:heme exporter protein D
MAEIIEFLKMGGYAAFIWPAYALVLMGLLLMWWFSRRYLRSLRNKLSDLESEKLKKPDDEYDS